MCTFHRYDNFYGHFRHFLPPLRPLLLPFRILFQLQFVFSSLSSFYSTSRCCKQNRPSWISDPLSQAAMSVICRRIHAGAAPISPPELLHTSSPTTLLPNLGKFPAAHRPIVLRTARLGQIRKSEFPDRCVSFSGRDQRLLPAVRRIGAKAGGSELSAAAEEQEWRCERKKKNAKVVAAAAVTVVLGVANRVLYKLALVPLKHYPFFLAQFATVG